MDRRMMRQHYRMLALNMIISTVIMYLLMFEMIWSFGEFFNNLIMFYMALPMGILMLVLMGSMYRDHRLNLIPLMRYSHCCSCWPSGACALRSCSMIKCCSVIVDPPSSTDRY